MKCFSCEQVLVSTLRDPPRVHIDNAVLDVALLQPIKAFTILKWQRGSPKCSLTIVVDP